MSARTMKYQVACGLAAGLFLVAGCGPKKEEPKATAPPMPTIPTPTVEGIPEPPPPEAPKMGTNAAATATATAPATAQPAAPLVRLPESQEEIDEMLAILNEQLAEHVAKTGKLPATADEFVRARRMGSLPPAPAGKQIVLDPQTKAFVVTAKK